MVTEASNYHRKTVLNPCNFECFLNYNLAQIFGIKMKDGLEK